MDSVHSAGDSLAKRPTPQAILDYKMAVRSFMKYVSEHTREIVESEGIWAKDKANYKGKKFSILNMTKKEQEEALERKSYKKIQVIDARLESMAAAIIQGQMKNLEILEKVEEIQGLLIDLLE
jgi:uncharacterized protein YaaR (DUF327 family)